MDRPGASARRAAHSVLRVDAHYRKCRSVRAATASSERERWAGYQWNRGATEGPASVLGRSFIAERGRWSRSPLSVRSAISSYHRVLLSAECWATARAHRSAVMASVIRRSRAARSSRMSLLHHGTHPFCEQTQYRADCETFTEEPCNFGVSRSPVLCRHAWREDRRSRQTERLGRLIRRHSAHSEFVRVRCHRGAPFPGADSSADPSGGHPPV